MTDTVLFYPLSTKDKYGKPTYGGTAVTTTGRLIYEEEKKRQVDGIEITAVGKYITAGPFTLTVNHKMSVSGTIFTVLAVDEISDENGLHHVVVSFGH